MTVEAGEFDGGGLKTGREASEWVNLEREE
jgi:hypothetical protein